MPDCVIQVVTNSWHLRIFVKCPGHQGSVIDSGACRTSDAFDFGCFKEFQDHCQSIELGQKEQTKLTFAATLLFLNLPVSLGMNKIHSEQLY